MHISAKGFGQSNKALAVNISIHWLITVPAFAFHSVHKLLRRTHTAKHQHITVISFRADRSNAHSPGSFVSVFFLNSARANERHIFQCLFQFFRTDANFNRQPHHLLPTCSKMEQVHLHFHKIDFAGTRLFQRHIISSAVTLACILLPHRQRIYLYPRLPNSMCTLRPHLRQWQSSAAPNSVSPSGRQKKLYSASGFKFMQSLHGYIRRAKYLCQRQLTHVFIFRFAFYSKHQPPVHR